MMATLSEPAKRYLDSDVRHFDTGSESIAYRVFGQGPPLLLVHGFPLHGFTFRKLLPHLVDGYTCYVVDLPGTGDARWSRSTDFSFPKHAERLKDFMQEQGVQKYSVLGHDTGATAARFLALTDRKRVKHLAIINTEIPYHRPPWVPFYQWALGLPFGEIGMRILLRSDLYLRSSVCLGGAFEDPNLLDNEFKEYFIRPMIRSAHRAEGMSHYVRAFDWSACDHLGELHRNIDIPVLFIWGQNDPTFPESEGKRMIEQFPNCKGWKSVPHTKLLPHEEKPEVVATHLKEFISSQ